VKDNLNVPVNSSNPNIKLQNWRNNLRPGRIVVHKVGYSERSPVMLIKKKNDGTFISMDMQKYWDERTNFYPATREEIKFFKDAQRMWNRIHELINIYKNNGKDKTGMRLLFFIESHFGDNEAREITQSEKDYIWSSHVPYIRYQEQEIRDSRNDVTYYRCSNCGNTTAFPHHCIGCGCAGIGDELWYDEKFKKVKE